MIASCQKHYMKMMAAAEATLGALSSLILWGASDVLSRLSRASPPSLLPGIWSDCEVFTWTAAKAKIFAT